MNYVLCILHSPLVIDFLAIAVTIQDNHRLLNIRASLQSAIGDT